jgi:hypothetical protein
MTETGLWYEIRIQGHLAPRRFRRIEGVTVLQETRGETAILGHFADQAALYGLLHWLQRLGATLLLVRRMEEPTRDRTASDTTP